MKNCMYCIYDKVALQASDPFYVPNDDVAKRHFAFSLSKMPSVAKDCVLYCCGAFDNETMAFDIPEGSPREVCDYSYIRELLENE